MTLTAELFREMLASLRGERPLEPARINGPSPLRDRRVRLGGRAIVIPCDGPRARTALAVTVRDMSPGGVSILAPVRLMKGDWFILRVPGVRRGDVHSVLCRAARWHPATDELFTVGATFLRQLSQDPVATPWD